MEKGRGKGTDTLQTDNVFTRKEYIEREAALSAQNKSMNLAECRKRLERLPAADVVSVVRCKDCRFWNRDKISVEGLARCNTGETGIRYRTENDFCSRGMRMDGDGDA